MEHHNHIRKALLAFVLIAAALITGTHLAPGASPLTCFTIPLIQGTSNSSPCQGHVEDISDFNACQPWVQVNDDAFGIPSNFDSNGDPIDPPPAEPYAAEEGFEVAIFNDQLYVGMEADNSLGARLWRTKAGVTIPDSQADWEEVIADANGCPFGNCSRQENGAGSGVFLLQNDHIDSLAEFGGYLYASTANGGSTTQGTQVWRSSTGDADTWTQVNADGFGDVNNTNFKDMQVFDGWLCGGTQNWNTGAQVWCTADGTTWEQKNFGGFGAGSSDDTNVEVWSGTVYSDTLYFGVQNTGADRESPGDDVAKLFRTTDLSGMPTWTEVYSSTAGSRRADILGDLGGYLYISVRSSDGIVILRSPNGDPGSWTQVNTAGMDGNPQNVGAVVDSATVYNGALYVGVANVDTGFEVWRTAGITQDGGPLVDWVQVDGSGLGDPNNGYTELIPFNGYLYAWTSNYVTGQQVLRSYCPTARYVILMIADGWGGKHIEAANDYAGQTPAYQSWTGYWMTTFPAGGGYDPSQAWSNFNYVAGGVTDSAAAATALYSGVKTANGRISVSADGSTRLFTIADKARALGKAVGAVSSVYVSHATPGAWYAHNGSRGNGYAIADEGFWGDPNTTGMPDEPGYSGGHGPTLPPADVILGAGHPAWKGGSYVNAQIRDKLAAESGAPGAHTFVERIAGSPDGGARLLSVASDTAVAKLAGLFGGSGGNLDYRLADGSGTNPENPTLADMAVAALTVLGRNPHGFVLMIEGGAIDWAAHGNDMDRMIGEQIGFNNAVETVVNWVEDRTNGSSWANTLLIVTGDHETGYLTAGPGVFPDQPLGEVSDRTLALEKEVAGSERHASWEDLDGDSAIDPGETVYWAWNSGGHTNSLIPLFAKGAGAELFAAYANGSDPVRGAYIDNTDVFKVMDAVTLNVPLRTCPNVVAPPEVDVEDVQAVASHWRQPVVVGSPYDVDGDGDVDVADVMRVAAAWGSTCR